MTYPRLSGYRVSGTGEFPYPDNVQLSLYPPVFFRCQVLSEFRLKKIVQVIDFKGKTETPCWRVSAPLTGGRGAVETDAPSQWGRTQKRAENGEAVL